MSTEVDQSAIEAKFDTFKTCTSTDIAKVRENRDILDQLIHSGPLEKFFDELETFFNMVDDYFTGFYTAVPFGTIAAIVGTLLYVISPVDLIPDFIPFLGHLVDAAMVGLCIKGVQFDIDAYRRWYEGE